jgi:hypothetical protein
MNKDVIVILADPAFYPEKGVRMAGLLADGFAKERCFLFINQMMTRPQSEIALPDDWIARSSISDNITIGDGYSELPDALEKIEASFLIIELSSRSRYHKIQDLLNRCRPLRIPYMFINEQTERVSLRNLLIPVSFLPEEKEKGIFASKLARFCHAKVTVMQAKDFGSRAAANVGAISTLFDKFSLTFELLKGEKDSFGIQKEAVLYASTGLADTVIITASREYGLDDLLFGPPERKMIASARVSIMFLNPRGDLYVLCD